MANIFEITTINLDKKSSVYKQDYSVIEIVPPDGIRTLEKGKYNLEEYAFRAYQMYKKTGLDSAIKIHPARVDRSEPEKLAVPEMLRLIYDINPMSTRDPILRICPVEKEQIWVAEYTPIDAPMNINYMSFHNEFEGTMDIWFQGLYVIMHFRNFDKMNNDYYSRELKENV